MIDFNKSNTKVEYTRTPHNTFRIWLKGDNLYSLKIIEHLNFLSCWGGPDVQESDTLSWELTLNLEEYLKNKIKATGGVFC